MLNHYVAHLKLIQYGKPTILQKKKKTFRKYVGNHLLLGML